MWRTGWRHVQEKKKLVHMHHLAEALRPTSVTNNSSYLVFAICHPKTLIIYIIFKKWSFVYFCEINAQPGSSTGEKLTKRPEVHSLARKIVYSVFEWIHSNQNQHKSEKVKKKNQNKSQKLHLKVTKHVHCLTAQWTELWRKWHSHLERKKLCTPWRKGQRKKQKQLLMTFISVLCIMLLTIFTIWRENDWLWEGSWEC